MPSTGSQARACTQEGVLTLRRAQLSDAPALRRHPPAYVVLHGWRRGRRAPRAMEAYRFAKGQEVTASSGQRAKLSRPLDFLVVADHSDGLGFFPLLFAGDPKIARRSAGPQVVRHDPGRARAWKPRSTLLQHGQGHDREGPLPHARAPRPSRTPGSKTIDAAEEANEPGRFTAFIGFEWTSSTGGNNLHRNVIFRRRQAKAGQVEPFTAQKPFGSDNPARPLEVHGRPTKRRPAARLLAIAHNGNWQQRPHVPDHRVVHRQADRPRVRRDAPPLGAAVRSDADEGHERGASVPFAERRVRRLRDLGQGQSRRERGQEARDARVRVRPRGAQERPEAREGARR